MFIPVIKDGECNNCKECSKICPKLVFDEENGKVTVSNPVYCTGCESCSAVCPKTALKIEEV